MLTLREALQMPIFATSRLVAGEAGLDNEINWVHTVDIPDARYEWHRQGVLLLTAGFGLGDNETRQAELVPKLVAEGFAGMVLSTGYYFQQTPEIIRQHANAHGFPVIEAPRDQLFIDITESILEQITSRQYKLLHQSSQIHKKLTDLVLEGGSLDDLAQTLAGLLKRSISIESPSFHVLTSAQFGPVDDARRRSVENGRTTPELANLLLKSGIYEQLRQRKEPMYVPPRPDLAMTMERFVAPIIVGHEIYGFIWIIAGDRPLTELDELALEQAATVAALLMFKETAVREAEEALRGDFLEQLLQGNSQSPALQEQARRLNFQLDKPHQLLLIYSESQTGGNGRSLHQTVVNWLQSCQANALIIPREELLVLVLQTDPNAQGDPVASGKQFAASLLADLSHPASRLLIGIGDPQGSLQDQRSNLQQSYQQAQEAIQVGKRLGQQEGVLAFADLGLLHWLNHIPAEQRRSNRYLQRIYQLNQYDQERKMELVKTLEAYLDNGGSLVETSQNLFIHRNTLLHRLERIKELCQLDLRDPLHRLNLHVAIKAYRLEPGQKP